MLNWIPFWNGSLSTIHQGWTQGTGLPRPRKQPKKLHRKADSKEVRVSASKVASMPQGSAKRPATVVITDPMTTYRLFHTLNDSRQQVRVKLRKARFVRIAPKHSRPTNQSCLTTWIGVCIRSYLI